MVLRTATGGLRMAFSPNSILRNSHNGTPYPDVPYSDIYNVAADGYFFHGQSFRSAISRAM